MARRVGTGRLLHWVFKVSGYTLLVVAQCNLDAHSSLDHTDLNVIMDNTALYSIFRRYSVIELNRLPIGGISRDVLVQRSRCPYQCAHDNRHPSTTRIASRSNVSKTYRAHRVRCKAACTPEPRASACLGRDVLRVLVVPQSWHSHQNKTPSSPSSTASLCFDNALDVVVAEFHRTVFVPYPRFHFMLCSYTPLPSGEGLPCI